MSQQDFRTWVEGYTDEEDARVFTAYDAESAAESAAEYANDASAGELFNWDRGAPDPLVVYVRDDSGSVTTYEVFAEAEINYSAYEKALARTPETKETKP